MAINFNTAPYYDDFNADDKFLQILFNPGRAVQARELTQIQSILQNQLSSGANHIFKNGSPTVGAELSLNIRNYIKLASADASWKGRYVYGVESLAIAQIVQLHDDELNRSITSNHYLVSLQIVNKLIHMILCVMVDLTLKTQRYVKIIVFTMLH